MQQTAKRVGGQVIVFPSQSQDRKKNPLPFSNKVSFLKQMFPRVSFNENTGVKTPFDALKAVELLGFTRVIVVVGSDRVEDFRSFQKYITKPQPAKSKKKADPNAITFESYQVVAVPGERDPDADDSQGMSASKLRGYATANDFKSFRQGVPTSNERLAKQLFDQVRTFMGVLKEMSLDKGIAHGKEQRAPYYKKGAQCDRTCRPGGGCPYCYGNRTVGDKKKNQSADDQMQDLQELFRSRAIRALDLREAEASKGPNVPTEADKLKRSQNQELIQTKTRQGAEMLAAKTRDLQKQSREQESKLNRPAAK